MPLILKEKYEEDCVFGIWEITEDYNTLYSMVHLYPGEKDRLDGFKSEDRKIEFLSVRVLLKNLAGDTIGPIVYSDKRKPFLHQSKLRISISHSKNLTAIMLSEKKKIGLDLEFMSHKISDIEDRFINEDEVIIREPGRRKYHLYIHWCAKEALYKICDKQDISFKKNLTIEPFEPEDFGVVYGWVDNKYWHDKFKLNYFTINNYVVVYCCKSS
ncbi:MAG: 4'-phosphopantetheinyl transferase superfamily protein [Bacteroidales bacterium]|nr:4'-phosphopantetheinyl transferase superfamily protein [Bacteroidales bacterium]